MSPPHTLSVAIITKNEEGNLARTLASVQFADEIIVLDSASTDRTVEIARAFNAKVFDEDRLQIVARYFVISLGRSRNALRRIRAFGDSLSDRRRPRHRKV